MCFWGQSHYAHDFYNLSTILCLQCAPKNGICCHGYDLIALLGEPTRIRHSTNSETTIL